MDQAAPSPACPRCGYDVAGLPTFPAVQPSPATGPHAAPADLAVRGVCPECGLTFEWVDVLDPSRHELPWLYEHTPRRAIGLRRAWATVLRALLPWRFWREVRLTSRISIGRLAAWLPVLIVPLHAAWAAAGVAREYAPAGWGRSRPTIEVFATHAGVPIVRAWRDPAGWRADWADADSSFLLPLGATLLAPIMLLILARTRATSRVRPAHILRAAVYSAGWIVGWYALWTGLTIAACTAAWVGTPGPWPRGPAFSGNWLGLLTIAGVGSCVAWFGTYWYFALARGMRLRRAGAVWALMMVACLLLGLNAALLDPRFVFDIGRRLFW